MVRKMETLLIQFQKNCENSVPLEQRSIVAAMDETFFGPFMILVLMDLTSGYLLLEDISDDRSFDTWFAKVTPRLKSLGIDVNYAVSDRAKALIKLAIAGFECDSVADTFHAQHDCSRLLGGQLGKRVETAQTAVNAAQQAEQNVSAKTSKEKVAKLQANTIEAEQTLAEAQKIQQDYHANLQAVSDAIHPFSLMDNTPNDATKIENELEQKAQVFEKIAKDAGISDKKNKINKFRNQIKPLTLGVHNWWLWVWETLKNLMVDEATQHWLTTILLPVVYWHYQMNKADKPHKRVKYQAAWERAFDTLKNHPLTAKLPPSEIQRWQMWAESMVRQFHRSSSAVEGRNGCLSQMYHNGRGITEQRLRANTVVHNYGLKREDGTTAAMRLFGTEFPDLFTWLVNEMGELPLPRERKKRAKPNVLNLIIVPA
jgi:hypothetical protein